MSAATGCADRALSLLDLDPRAEVKAAQRALLLSTCAFAALLVVPVIVAFGLRSAPSAAILVGFLLPVCGAAGVRWRSTGCLRLVYCCTPVVAVIFVVGAYLLSGVERRRFDCICDPNCDALPAAAGGGGGGSIGGVSIPFLGRLGRVGGGGGNLTNLRKSALYVLECGEKGAVEAAFGIYPAVGAIAFALQIAACVFSCRIARFWRDHGVSAAPVSSEAPPTQLPPAGAASSFGGPAAQHKPDAPQLILPVGMSIRTRGGLQLVSYAPTGGGGGGGAELRTVATPFSPQAGSSFVV